MASGDDRPTVWVVDDNALDASVAAGYLRGSYEVETIGDGPTALARLTSERPPDALVLDWVMPDLSGIDVVQFLRGCDRPELNELKVLLLTAQGAPEQVAEGLSAGANDYLAKPYAAIELQARVGALIRSLRLAARARTAERMVHDLMAEAPDAILAMDAAERVTWTNREARRVLGDGLVGRPIGEVLPGLSTRPGPSADIGLGDRLYAPSLRSVSIEQISGTVLTLRDVTEARRAADRRLDFYSMIAHDLRSPLSNMVLRVQLIERGALGEVGERVALELGRIEDSVHQLVRLVDDFLEIARFESMSHNLARERVGLCRLVTTVCGEYGPSIEQSALQLRVDCAEEEVEVVGDERRLRQVLTNLLSNAIKFTPAGGRVDVSVWREGDDACLAVRDTGKGIAPEVMKRLFTRFTRDEVQPGAQGTGLGLVIVDNIVGAHGGHVEVDSEVGRGTRFVVRLPAA